MHLQPTQPEPAAALRPLLILAALHGLVDTFVLFVQPLWPDLQRSFARGPDDVQWSYISWSLASSFSQLFFGYWGDRQATRWLLWLGPALGMLCVCSIGLIDSFLLLNSVLFLGGLGIAAFHPEAAAAAGACLPQHRSRAMSIFAVGGYLGQAAGPLYSGVITTRFGIPALAWTVPAGILALAIIIFALRRGPAHIARAADRPTLATLLANRKRTLALLLVTSTLRVLPILGVPLALAFAIKSAGGDNDQIGLVQSIFLVGIGVGSLASAWVIRPENERTSMWLMPLAAVGPIAACGWLSGPWGWAAVGISGLILGGAMPVLIGYGQQLLPEAQRVASSITMGVTWGLGAICVALLMSYFNRLGNPQQAIYLFAGCAAASGLLSIQLPRHQAGDPTATDTPSPAPAEHD